MVRTSKTKKRTPGSGGKSPPWREPWKNVLLNMGRSGDGVRRANGLEQNKQQISKENADHPVSRVKRRLDFDQSDEFYEDPTLLRNETPSSSEELFVSADEEELFISAEEPEDDDFIENYANQSLFAPEILHDSEGDISCPSASSEDFRLTFTTAGDDTREIPPAEASFFDVDAPAPPVADEENPEKYQRWTKISAINVNSIKTQDKYDLVQTGINNLQSKVIIVSETGLNPSIKNSMRSFAGYSIASRQDRHEDSTEKGGGVMICVKSDIRFRNPRAVKISEKIQYTEVLVGDLRIIGVYRAPQTKNPEDKKLIKELKEAFERGPCIMGGDLNAPSIDWDDMSPGLSADLETDDKWSFKGALCRLVLEHDLRQLIDEATFTRSGNILDIFLTNDARVPLASGELVKTAFHEDIWQPDHFPIRCEVRTVLQSQRRTRTFRDMAKADFGKMKQMLNHHQLQDEFPWDLTGEEQLDWFDEKFRAAQDAAIPMKTVTIGGYPSWYGKDLIESMKLQENQHARLKRPAPPGVKAERKKRLGDTMKRNLKWRRRRKRKYEQNMLDNIKSNPDAIYKHVKRENQLDSDIGPILFKSEKEDEPDKLAVTEKDMADGLCDFFGKNRNDENLTQPDWLDKKPKNGIHKQLSRVKVGPKEVKRAIKKLRGTAAAGSDGIMPKAVKACKGNIAVTLAQIFNRLVNIECNMPASQKLAKVIPLKKSGNVSAQVPKSYRPVSLNNIWGKVLEIIVCDQLTAHVEGTGRLHQDQHGFRRRLSTTTLLLKKWRKIVTAREKTGITLLLLDYSSAFDLLPFDKILEALFWFGIRGALGFFLASWLHDRNLYVQVGEKTSEIVPQTSGVPQGSVLSPLLFIMTANESLNLEGQNGSLKMSFADDTIMCEIITSVSKQKFFQHQVDRLVSWCERMKMRLNPEKSRLMRFGRQLEDLTVRIKGKVVSFSDYERDLGINIATDGKFKKHWAEKIRAANGKVATFKKSTELRTKEYWNRIWDTYIEPTILYASQVTYQNLSYVNDSLMRLWRNFWRCVGGPPENKLNPVERILFLDLKYVKRWSMGLINMPMSLLFDEPLDGRTRNFKDGRFRIPKRSSIPGRSEFGARMAVSYPSLPLKVRKMKLPAFCRTVKQLILQKSISIRCPILL